MSALAVFGQNFPQRMSAEEVGKHIGSALHAGLAITQGDVRQADIQRERLKLGAQAIMQSWRDLDECDRQSGSLGVLTAAAERMERRNTRKRPALA